MKHFLTLKDLTRAEIIKLLDSSIHFKTLKKDNITHNYLTGKSVVLLFQKDSTRTRSAFEVASYDLGMLSTYVGPSGSQLGKKESFSDTAKVLSRMYHGIEFRGYDHNDVEDLALNSSVPVWNGLTNQYHPTQALADMMTIKENFRDKKVKVAYLGNVKNNVAVSLMIICAKLGYDFIGIGPEEYMPSNEDIDYCKKLADQNNSSILMTSNIEKGLENVSVIYTDVWVSMGEDKKTWEKRIKDLLPYQVNEKIMSMANKESIFLHCLPAFHDLNTFISNEIYSLYKEKFPSIKNGLEVSDSVFNSSQSKVFDQAENRLHTIKAIMYETLK